MPSDIFHASRFTRGNFLFPTVIEVTDKSVMRRKRSWFNVDEMSITISKVASIHIKTGIIWSKILIGSLPPGRQAILPLPLNLNHNLNLFPLVADSI